MIAKLENSKKKKTGGAVMSLSMVTRYQIKTPFMCKVELRVLD